MSTQSHPPVDRTGWLSGPWDNEPDRWEGEHEGFPLLAVRNRYFGHWCGYVAVPPGHPWHGVTFDLSTADHEGEAEPSVHGGVTYTDSCAGDVCHVPKPGEPDSVWWIGFDCHHFLDLAPRDEITSSFYGMDPRAQYKRLEYVQNECRALARQAAERASNA